jgi:hypothetical protein
MLETYADRSMTTQLTVKSDFVHSEIGASADLRMGKVELIANPFATARGTDLFERPRFYLSNECAPLRGGFGRKRKIKLWNIAKCLAENSA